MRTRFLLVAPALLFLFVASARAAGPVWTARDIDTFQDNFASDGSTTGSVRADMAADILPPSSPGIQPGDSSVVVVSDPTFGLATDGVLGGKAVYCYVAVYPLGQSSKAGAGISGGARWPFAGTEVVSGISWTKLRFDQSDLGGGPVPDNFCIDLNDNLFTPGDTIFFFYGAKSDDGPGSMSYFSLEFGTTADITIAATLPMEFTCLPAGGWKRGGDKLYVDGADGYDSEQYFHGALMVLHLVDKIDRYDVRAPSFAAGNTPAGRVRDVQFQLNDCYTGIIWDCGSLNVTLGDGPGGNAQKVDDYELLNVWLGNHTNPGGVYLSGDDVAENLYASSSSSTTTFKALYMPFTLVTGNHRLPPTNFAVSPSVIQWPFRFFAPDNFIVSGVAPELKDFDVMSATASSLVEKSYNSAQSPDGALLSNINGNARVLLSGFSFAAIRDDEVDGISDRAKHLRDIVRWVQGGGFPGITGADPVPDNRLLQNHPNPFNPATTIEFSLASREHIRLAIYDVNGALVRDVVDETRDAGGHAATWDGRDNVRRPVASGVYFYRLVAGSFSETRKMVLLK